jgi:hypothetical protein
MGQLTISVIVVHWDALLVIPLPNALTVFSDICSIPTISVLRNATVPQLVVATPHYAAAIVLTSSVKMVL